MSYCRFGKKNDVFVYPHVDGYIQCCSCKLTKPIVIWLPHTNKKSKMQDNFNCKKPETMIKHLMEHIEHGHHVPKYAIARLLTEIKCKK